MNKYDLVYDLIDKFDNASTDGEREEVRQQIQELGFSGVARTIGRGDENHTNVVNLR
jgi:hypothetical protein